MCVTGHSGRVAAPTPGENLAAESSPLDISAAKFGRAEAITPNCRSASSLNHAKRAERALKNAAVLELVALRRTALMPVIVTESRD